MAKKLIVRADDIGLSMGFDIGALRAIDNGIVTAADVMLDGENAPWILAELRKRPWISVGWHTHFWNAPVLDPAQVPTLMGKDGRFRKDIQRAEDVSYDEIYAEMKAQMMRCGEILGRTPDTGPKGNPNGSPFQRAMAKIVEEYGIAYNFAYGLTSLPDGSYVLDGEPIPQHFFDEMNKAWGGQMSNVSFKHEIEEKWASRKIYNPNILYVSPELTLDSLKEFEARYDAPKFYYEDRFHLLDTPDDYTIVSVWHPGYVDETVLYKADDGTPMHICFQLSRVADAHGLQCPKLKAWLKEHGIALVSFRDALYGTNDYQRWLQSVGSDLYIG